MGITPDRSRPTSRPGLPTDGSTNGRSHAWTAETLSEVRPALNISAGADASSATRLRRAFSAWLAVDVTGDQLDDLVLAVYEAVANTAEHAYADHPDRAGPVRLFARRSHAVLQVTIADDGRWRPPTGEPYRSRGLPLIRALVEDVHIDHTPTGTAVHLRAALPPPGQSLP